MATYAHRSDDQRAAVMAALAANGDNVSKTARECGVARSTIARWRDDGDGAPPPEMVKEQKLSLAELWEELTRDSLALMGRAVGAAADGEDADLIPMLPDLNRVAGTGTDKALLLRGQPTEFKRYEIVLDLGASEL